MNINSNFSTNGVTGPSSTKTAVKRTTAPAASGVSLEGTSALEASLRAIPDVRPEAVDRARTLINDPTYPSQAVLKQISNFLAKNLTSEQA